MRIWRCCSCKHFDVTTARAWQRRSRGRRGGQRPGQQCSPGRGRRSGYGKLDWPHSCKRREGESSSTLLPASAASAWLAFRPGRHYTRI
jgi:hypothetical protein